MTISRIDELADLLDTPLMRLDGFDDCVVGVVTRHTQAPLLCYDKARVLSKLAAQGMSALDAHEYFQHNIACAWVGEGTPCFLETLPEDPEGEIV